MPSELTATRCGVGQWEDGAKGRGGLGVTATRSTNERDGHELDRKRQDEEMPGRAGMQAHAWRQPWRTGRSSRPDRLATHTPHKAPAGAAQALCRTASGQASCRVHETCGVAIRAAQRRGHRVACTQELSFPNGRKGFALAERQVKSRKHKSGFKGAKAGAHTGTGANAAAPVVSSTSPTAAATAGHGRARPMCLLLQVSMVSF